MKYLEKEQLGTIQLGDKIRVSDPCYDLDVWCSGSVEDVLPGNYMCYIQALDFDDWGHRVSSIEVRHKDHPSAEPTEVQGFVVGVDSGQAGIYDLSYYLEIQKDESLKDRWYDRVCELTYQRVKNPDYTPFEKSSYWKDSFKILHYLRCKTDDLLDYIISCGKDNIDYLIDNMLVEMDESKAPSDEEREYIKMRKEYLNANLKERIEYMDAKHAWESSYEGREIQERLWGGVIDNKGVVSSSGYGDGSYTCLVGRNSDGKVVSVKVDYFYYEDDEEEEC